MSSAASAGAPPPPPPSGNGDRQPPTSRHGAPVTPVKRERGIKKEEWDEVMHQTYGDWQQLLIQRGLQKLVLEDSDDESDEDAVSYTGTISSKACWTPDLPRGSLRY